MGRDRACARRRCLCDIIQVMRFASVVGIAAPLWLPLALQGQTLQTSPPVDSAAFRIEGNRFSGIAQGGVFTAFTSNGPAQPVSATSLPLGTSLGGGTSIRIQVNDTVCEAPMLAAARTQVTAIACSNLPAGLGNMTYSFSGQSAAAQQIRIVEHNPTIFTVGQTGQGPGVVTHADGESRRHALGPPASRATSSSCGFRAGARSPPIANRLPLIAARLSLRGLLLGEQPLVLDYYGGSGCCAGLWQLAARVPDEPTFGCFVPLHLNQGDSWSDNVTVAVAPAGQATCSDAHNFDAASVEILRNNVYLVFSAVMGGYSVTSFRSPASICAHRSLGLFTLVGLGYTPTTFYLGPEPNAVGSCQVRAVTATQTDPYSQQFLGVQGGAGLLFTLDDGSTINVPTGFDPQIGGVVSPVVPFATLNRLRSVRINDSQFATSLGGFSVTGGLTINLLPAPRIDREQVRREILETLFRAGQPARDAPVTVALTEPVPENLLLNIQLGVAFGAVDHLVDCYFPGGRTQYQIPARAFANIPDSSTGLTGVFSAQTLQPGPIRAQLGQGVELRSSAENVVSIGITR